MQPMIIIRCILSVALLVALAFAAFATRLSHSPVFPILDYSSAVFAQRRRLNRALFYNSTQELHTRNCHILRETHASPYVMRLAYTPVPQVRNAVSREVRSGALMQISDTNLPNTTYDPHPVASFITFITTHKYVFNLFQHQVSSNSNTTFPAKGAY